MKTRIPIESPLREICERLDVDYDNVREMVIRPGETTVTLFELRDDGAKFIDGKTGEPATRTQRFEVRT